MKCIDAIEGTVKNIIKEIHLAHTRNRADDSEYIYNVKAVIDATDQYVRNQPELIENPDILKQVLYVFSRNLWLLGQQPDAAEPKAKATDSENEEYQTYYFDYIYNRGVYPG